ncbi:2-polyprenyl-6-methoxyphenol hydroxylase [Betaproteobacteria bacterium SCGC AG-212-J23]|nr:2-polyprenyl-6-methoxyphenol hydroxylase [Betaproteobacteria bacterium SCGC AG-212-J23]
MLDTEVLIVGAGPVGLTLAVDLGQKGVRCTLIERKDAPQFLPKMERCNARTMEIYRRMGIAAKVRAAGLRAEVPMDVFIVTALDRPPLVHHKYPSVAEARRAIDACTDGSMPLEPYQLISQYTLEPLLKKEAETLPSVTVKYGCELDSFVQDADGVTATTSAGKIRAKYLVGCDGGGSIVRKQLGIGMSGENLSELRQALYRCDELFDRIPIGPGPGHGRHYHVADERWRFLIMQDSTQHWTLHAVVDDDAQMAHEFERTIGVPVKYEMLYVGKWRQNLLLADRYRDGRVFLAGDSVHLVIPTGGLGMNSGVGDAADLAWKLAATLRGWGGPRLLDAYEIERRQVGERNVAASRYASLGRRKWRALWQNLPELARVAEIEQRKSNEMIGAELGYRYAGSPLICEEPGAPEDDFRSYVPGTWPGARLPHVWLDGHVALQDRIGPGYTLLRFSGEDASSFTKAFKAVGAPFEVLDLRDARARDVYGFDLILLRPDLHVAWRGNRTPREVVNIARAATGHFPGQ